MNGVNKVVYQLATQQALAGKKVSLWGITQNMEHNYPERNFATRLFRACRNKFAVDKNLLRAIESKKGAAIFHLHGGFNPVFTVIARRLHRLGIAFVFTPHGAYNTIALKKNAWLKKIYLRLFEIPMLKRAAAIHSLGQSEVSGLQHIYRNNKSQLIAYGYQKECAEIAQPAEEKFIIGFCGRIDIYTKGLDLLADAFARLKKQAPEAALWILGDGSERYQLVQLLRDKNISDDTVLWGSCFGTEKWKLMQQLHVFAHPSRNEGLPSAVLEAAALGIPCVVTRATNTGEAIAKYKAGEVIAAPDAGQLYTALLHQYHLFKNKQWQAVSLQAQLMAATEYNWQRIIAQFDKLYMAS
jgi:glycosyltransferase involved in cell wall biosynthesis